MLQVAFDRKRGVGPPILSGAVAGCVAAMRGHGSRRPCGMLQVAFDRKRGVGQSKHDGAEPSYSATLGGPWRCGAGLRV